MNVYIHVQIARLQKQIEAYCADDAADASLNFGGSMLFIRSAFNVFRTMIRAGPGTLSLPGGGGGDGKAGGGGGAAGADGADLIKKLKLQVI